MKKVEEYERHVEECLNLAKSATSEEHRKMLWNMAETWKTLADERRRKQLKHTAAVQQQQQIQSQEEP